MSKNELLSKIAELEAKNATLQSLVSQAASVAANRHGKRKIFGLGLVFGRKTETGEWEEVGERMPRMEFQDALFAQNEIGWVSVDENGEQKVVHLTDNQLLILNKVEHPMCEGRMDLGIVVGMRRLYNEGKHSKNFPIPEVKSRAWAADGITPVSELKKVAKSA